MITLSPDYAAPFARMTQRIGDTVDHKFAGAVVVVPPTGPAIELLLLDESQDGAAFWSLASTKIQIAANDFLESDKGQKNGWR